MKILLDVQIFIVSLYGNVAFQREHLSHNMKVELRCKM